MRAVPWAKNILIVADTPSVRAGVRSALETPEGLRVYGEAADVVEAVEKAREHRPDIVLLAAPLEQVSVTVMVPPFDIYRLKSNEELLWIGTEDSLEAAKEFVTKYGHTQPGEYLICSLKTEPEIWIKMPAAEAKGAGGQHPSS